MVWALLTPRDNNENYKHKIKNIAVAAIYSKPRSRKKTALLDHVGETFNLLSAKYGDGLHFIIAGDTNDLKLESIINLSPNLRQVVTVFTRHNPDAILDPIITTLSKFYQSPVAKPPLDNDPEKNGTPSDHNIIVMKPINNMLSVPARQKKKIIFRPLPISGIQKMGQWIVKQTWEEVYEKETAHDKASVLQNMLVDQMNECLPQKSITVTSDDQPWITKETKGLDRRRKREFYKNRKSLKWRTLDEKFKQRCTEEKANYYNSMVKDLKTSQPKQWYSKLKRMSSIDQTKNEDVLVENIASMSNKDQAEKIADEFAKVSNEYEV